MTTVQERRIASTAKIAMVRLELIYEAFEVNAFPEAEPLLETFDAKATASKNPTELAMALSTLTTRFEALCSAHARRQGARTPDPKLLAKARRATSRPDLSVARREDRAAPIEPMY